CSSCYLSYPSASAYFRPLPPPPSPTLFPYTTLFRSFSNPQQRHASSTRREPPFRENAPSPSKLKIPLARVTRMMASQSRREMTRSEEHTSELQSRFDLVCRLLLEKKKERNNTGRTMT